MEIAEFAYYDVLKDEVNTVRTNYCGIKVRFAQLYDWFVDVQVQAQKDYISRICKFLNANIPQIESAHGLRFLKSNDGVSISEGKYGQFLEFPKFIYTKDIELKGKLRINHSVKSFDKKRKCRCKIWVNVNNSERILMDGEAIHNLIEMVRRSCKELVAEVARCYSKACGDLPDADPYWLSFETAVLTRKDAQKRGIESLFTIGDKVKFIESFHQSPATQRTLADVLERLYNKKIDDPLMFIRQLEDDQVEWKVARNSAVSVFYVEKNCDNFFRIVAVGRTESPDVEILAVDKIFSQTVAQLVMNL